MEFVHYDNQIVLCDDNNKVLANVTFPSVSENLVNVNHTFVDDGQRGKGIANKLMLELVKNLETTNRRAKLTCSYAMSWFKKNPQYGKYVKNR